MERSERHMLFPGVSVNKFRCGQRNILKRFYLFGKRLQVIAHKLYDGERVKGKAGHGSKGYLNTPEILADCHILFSFG